MILYRQTGDSNGGMWNFESGSYGTEEAKAKLKGEPYHPDNIRNQNVVIKKTHKPSNLEDDLDDLGLDEGEI